jgi:hypothetical protein
MQNQQSHNHLSPVDRLLRDLRAVGRLDPGHVPVNERLHGELGEALQAVLRRELAGFDAADFPLEDHTRRVA